jgi:hypothetical protein
MFPNDAITIRSANDTSGDNVPYNILPSGVYTVLNISINSKDARDSVLYCGSTVLFKQRTATNIDIKTNYICNNPITATIDRTSTLTFTYVPYDLHLQSTTTQQIILTNSGISLKQGFTYGEVLIILVLLMIFTQAFFSELKQWFFGVRIENPMKNKYNKDL